MSGHDAKAVRINGAGAIWHAVCPAGCRLTPARGKEHAELIAKEHAATELLNEARAVAERLTCDCFHPDEAEFYPDYVCVKCQLDGLLNPERAA